MRFTPIFYVCIACPTVGRTLNMLDQYVERGACAFQIDMPSKDPFSETEFVRQMMYAARESEPDYCAYMEAIREIRRRYAQIELHIVVYNDVIDSIGLERFEHFCHEIGARSLMIPGASAENLLFLELGGLPVFRTITHELTEPRIRLALALGESGYLSLRNKKPGERDIPGLETFEKKYRYIRERGVKAPVYNVFGISSGQQLAAVRAAGACGAIIGNTLMKLWGKQYAFTKLLDEFLSQAY